MQTITIVAIVRCLIDAQQTNDQIAATLDRMQSAGGENQQLVNRALDATIVQATTGRKLAPSVDYRLSPGMTAERIARITAPRLQQVLQCIVAHGPITKRQIMDRLGIGNGAAMSAVHQLQTMDAIVSQPIDAPTPPNTPVRIR